MITEIFPPRVGGSGRYLWEVYRRMPRGSYVVAAGETAGQREFDQQSELPTYRRFLDLSNSGVSKARGVKHYWHALSAIRRIIDVEGISRIHCARCIPEGWIALLLNYLHGIPYVCFAHGEEVNLETSGDAHGVMSSRQNRWMGRHVLRGAEFLVANSQNTARLLHDGWGISNDRIHVLHPGVDTRVFQPTLPDPGTRNQLGWNNRTVILTVSRLQKRKGHDRLIRALHEIRVAIPDILYAIVGDGEESKALKNLVRHERLVEHVVFHGKLKDEEVLKCYQQCDLFVLPNRQVGEDIEGFGMVLLEAQACGKAVVAGDSGGTSETMNVPETGRIVRCDAHLELAECILDLLSDRNRLATMGEKARDWVVKRFDWDVVANRAYELFERGVSQNSVGHIGVGARNACQYPDNFPAGKKMGLD